MNMGQISLRPLTKATSGVVSDSELLAPKANGPAGNAEGSGDVFLENALVFETPEKLMVWTAIRPTGNSVFLAITIDRASADAKDGGDC